MCWKTNGHPVEEMETIIVGAGMSGVYALAEAKHRGIQDRVLILERKSRTGGLWVDLPEWQTVQNSPIDFCMQGFTTKKQVWNQGDVLHMMDEYVRLQGLASRIRFNTDVLETNWDEELQSWAILTKSPEGHRYYMCRNIVFCVGRHSEPIVPDIPTDGSIPILHSSEIKGWADLKGKHVAVLGAGASALDLLLNVVELDDKVNVEWIFREPRFFTGCLGNVDVDLFKFHVAQLLSPQGSEIVSFLTPFYEMVIRLRFWWAGLSHWLPSERLDISKFQPIPARGQLLYKKNSRRINRHCGTEIKEVRDGYVHLANGKVVGPVEAVLLGTGYGMPKFPPGAAEIVDPVREHMIIKSTVPGKHFARLHVLSTELLDTVGSTPLSSSLLAPVLWTGISTDYASAKFQDEKTTDKCVWTWKVNNLEMIVRFARRMPELYPWLVWRLRMLWNIVYYRYAHGTTVFYPDRIVALGHNLDDRSAKPKPKPKQA